jgi:hypothetical protein
MTNELTYLQLVLLLYALTVLIETPILVIGLSRRHPLARRLFLGVWLTGCTYPIVALVLPSIFDLEQQRALYLAVAETFAPFAECVLFWWAYGAPGELRRGSTWRDFGVITVANLASFLTGELLYSMAWLR